MREQEVILQISKDDPFATKKVKIKLPVGVKLLSTEPYAIEDLKKYGVDVSNLNHVNEKEYITTGTVISVDDNKALIDLGKYTGYCQLDKEFDYIKNYIVTGKDIEVLVRHEKSNIYVSPTDAYREKTFQDLYDSIGNKGVAFTGKVLELIHGGYWVDIIGIKCFMPGSLGGINKLHDFESLIGKELVVMPVNYDSRKNIIVVSHREFLRTQIPKAIEDIKNNQEQLQTGSVTGTTKFGIFVEFNDCLTGLIQKKDLNEEWIKRFENQDILPGDEIDFWVTEIISNRKIVLSQLGPTENPWKDIEERFKPSQVVKGKITKVTKYGAFIEIEEGISGLLHKSKIKNINLEVGQSIHVKILSIKPDKEKINFGLMSDS